MASTTEYTVTGMTCQHCVNAVTREVGGIDGVTGVDVDLDSGRGQRAQRAASGRRRGAHRRQRGRLRAGGLST